MSSKHTPTPWKVGPGPSVKVGGRYNIAPTITAGGSAKGMIDEREIARANADFIVRACNSNEQLVAALQQIIAADDAQELTDADIEAGRAALAAAGAA